METTSLHSRQIGPDLGNRLPEQFLYLLLRQARHLHRGHPGQFAAHHLGIGECLAGPPSLADVEVVEALALAGMPQLSPPLAHRDTRPPLCPPIRAVIGPRRGTGLPLLHLNRLNRRGTVVFLFEPIRLVRVEVDPLDAIGVTAARRHHIHRRHRRLPYPLVAEPQSRTNHEAIPKNRWSPAATGVTPPGCHGDVFVV